MAATLSPDACDQLGVRQSLGEPTQNPQLLLLLRRQVRRQGLLLARRSLPVAGQHHLHRLRAKRRGVNHRRRAVEQRASVRGTFGSFAAALRLLRLCRT